jgi:anti-sigma B factor antagonist
VEIGERRHGDILVLRPEGRLDNLASAEFQARLLAASSDFADIVVDLSAVDYISSAGLRALMVASRHKPNELRLAVACLNEVVREIFAISRFSEVVANFATVEEAIAAWEAAPRPRGRRRRPSPGRRDRYGRISGARAAHCRRRCGRVWSAARSTTR